MGLPDAARGHLAMLVFSALVAGSFSLGALAANLIDPAALNAVRFWVAAAIIGALALATTGLPRRAARAPWRYLLLGGLFAAYFVLMFEGLKTANPVSTSAVFTLTPLMSAGFAWLLMRQRLTGRMGAALIVGGAGAVWVIFRADPAALMRFEIGHGETLYFYGCIAHALYTPLVRRLNRGESPVVFTFGMLVAGGVLLGLWAAPEIAATRWAELPPIVWVTLAYVAIFASAASFLALQYATLHLPSAKVMAYTYLTPSWVIVWEMALGQDAPRGMVLLGIAATVAALLILLKDEEPSA